MICLVMFLYKSLGFSTIELLIAGAILTITISASAMTVFTIQDLSLDNSQTIQAINLLSSEMSLLANYDNSILPQNSTEIKGDFTVNKKYTPLSRFATEVEVEIKWQRKDLQKDINAVTIITDYQNSFGTDTCDLYIKNMEEPQKIISSFVFPTMQNLTDIDVVGNLAFVSVNNANLSDQDLFVMKIKVDNSLELIGSLNTGPGIDAIAVAGDYIYVANTSINSQLQIIDIANPLIPILIKNYKLPNISGTNAVAHSILYQDEKVYLGTVKTTGPEFNIIDVTNKISPQLLGSYEANTEINNILVDRDVAYITTPNQQQLRLLDIRNPNMPILASTFSDSGFEAQDGRSIDVLGNNVFFGRTVGGFNNPSNHELYNISKKIDNTLLKTSSVDLAASSRVIIYRNGHLFVGTNDPSKEWQIWKVDQSQALVFKSLIDLSASVVAVDCQDQQFFVALENSRIEILGHDN